MATRTSATEWAKSMMREETAPKSGSEKPISARGSRKKARPAAATPTGTKTRSTATASVEDPAPPSEDRRLKNIRMTRGAQKILRWVRYTSEQRDEPQTRELAIETALLAYWGPRKRVAEGEELPEGSIIAEPSALSGVEANMQATSFRISREALSLVAWAVYDAEVNDRPISRERAVDLAVRGYWGPRMEADQSK